MAALKGGTEPEEANHNAAPAFKNSSLVGKQIQLFQVISGQDQGKVLKEI